MPLHLAFHVGSGESAQIIRTTSEYFNTATNVGSLWLQTCHLPFRTYRLDGKVAIWGVCGQENMAYIFCLIRFSLVAAPLLSGSLLR